MRVRGPLLALTLALSCLSVGCDRASRGDTAPSPLPLASTGLACGVERWSVKTLADADALRLDFARATLTTVAALNAVPMHCGTQNDRRAFPEEFQVYEIVGRVTDVRVQDDRDYHVVLDDPAGSGARIVTEVVEPACSSASGSFVLPMLARAKEAFHRLAPIGRTNALEGQVVRVRGVGFYDFNHGQIGRARSCLELHPVLSIDLERSPT